MLPARDMRGLSTAPAMHCCVLVGFSAGGGRVLLKQVADGPILTARSPAKPAAEKAWMIKELKLMAQQLRMVRRRETCGWLPSLSVLQSLGQVLPNVGVTPGVLRLLFKKNRQKKCR
jgi:hypothetical protein